MINRPGNSALAQLRKKQEEEMQEWRGSFLRLEENFFFNLMHLHLGNFESPFNSQNLVLRLEGILRKEENQKKIISLLSRFDIMVLCAVYFIPDATLQRVVTFFKRDYSEKAIVNSLRSLQARLLIYAAVVPTSDVSVYKLNPILKEALMPFVSIRLLIPECGASDKGKASNIRGALNIREAEGNPVSVPPVTQELIAAVLSFVARETDLCKLDGTLKKKAALLLEEKFPGRVIQVEIILNAFKNLRIIKELDSGFEVDWKKADDFARLSDLEQYVYIICAARSKSLRERMAYYSEIFLNAVRNIPDGGFTTRSFLKYVYLASLRPQEEEVLFTQGKSRFAQILEQGERRLAEQKSGQNSEQISMPAETSESAPEPASASSVNSTVMVIERMIDDAAALGLLRLEKAGGSDSDTSVFRERDDFILNDKDSIVDYEDEIIFKGSALQERKDPPQSLPMININAGYSVSLMPGFSLSKILPLMRFMDIARFDTVSQFEISRDSALRGFSSGLTSEKELSVLRENTSFELPQTLVISLEEWEASYNSVAVFKGYVLRLTEKTLYIAEKNPVLKKHIVATIAPGIFLLDVQSDFEFDSLMVKSGFESARKYSGSKNDVRKLDFIPLKKTKSLFAVPENQEKSQIKFSSSKDRQKILKKFYDQVDLLEISEDKKEILNGYVSAKTIINESQFESFKSDSLPSTASSLYYGEKRRILEEAIKHQEEILYSMGKEQKKEIARPIKIISNSDEAGAYVIIESDGAEKEISIGSLFYVHRIRRLDIFK